MSRDRLDRRRLAASVSQTLKAVSADGRSAVVALVGPWGSGKSTLLDAVAGELSVDGGWHIASHNPWGYATYEAAAAGFFSELASALPDDNNPNSPRKAIGKWIAQVAPFGSVISLVGVDLSAAMGAAANLISGDQSPEALRAEAELALKKLGARVVVLLDDLDRLEPSELLATFKLVRLLGRLPNVYYLLSYDEETLVDILLRTELVDNDRSRAQQYLEKMVQIRIDIPPLMRQQRLDLFNDHLTELQTRHNFTIEGEAITRLGEIWDYCLVHYMDQPRALKRLFVQVDATWAELSGEVDFVDFLLVSFLRTFEKNVFDLIVQNEAELLGVLPPYTVAGAKESNAQTWARWTSMLKDAKVRHLKAVEVLMASLFLVLRGARENATYSTDYHADIAKRQGIASVEYFDRYVQMGVPKGDVAEGLVRDSVVELASLNEAGEAVTKLRDLLTSNARRAFPKLERRAEIGSLPVAPIASLIASAYISMIEQNEKDLASPSPRRIGGFIAKLLSDMESGDAVETVRRLCRDQPGLLLAADATQVAVLADVEEVPLWATQAADIVVQRIEFELHELAIRPIDDNSRFVMKNLWTIFHLRSGEYAQSVVDSMLAEVWNVGDLLALMVPPGTVLDGGANAMVSPSSGDMDTLIGLARIFNWMSASGMADSTDDAVIGLEGNSIDSRRRIAIALVGKLMPEQENL